MAARSCFSFPRSLPSSSTSSTPRSRSTSTSSPRARSPTFRHRFVFSFFFFFVCLQWPLGGRTYPSLEQQQHQQQQPQSSPNLLPLPSTFTTAREARRVQLLPAQVRQGRVPFVPPGVRIAFAQGGELLFVLCGVFCCCIFLSCSFPLVISSTYSFLLRTLKHTHTHIHSHSLLITH